MRLQAFAEDCHVARRGRVEPLMEVCDLAVAHPQQGEAGVKFLRRLPGDSSSALLSAGSTCPALAASSLPDTRAGRRGVRRDQMTCGGPRSDRCCVQKIAPKKNFGKLDNSILDRVFDRLSRKKQNRCINEIRETPYIVCIDNLRKNERPGFVVDRQAALTITWFIRLVVSVGRLFLSPLLWRCCRSESIARNRQARARKEVDDDDD